ncbi:apiosidase-like domain-containing protein [Streptococcus moroccensis]|uniref:Apiosidase-like catalytic domain-containing protein n=1 Tax=Streptococcus moroccensis TaxID=1451356 RepID=A0ABT9YTH2_9STRE|nr:DUF4038 domain-containing protein [Streptococcus moroccensis]MDQ0222425.1 hypothetical protein [Streptococcus moroccensis]
MFKVSNNKRVFTKNGKETFYLADTCWSAFTNISEEDWEYYLNYRKEQGFNVIQVNMLWQWDSSSSRLGILPFSQKENGYFDYSQPNEDYFERAERMIGMAYEKGITVALVLLWANYIPDTWASQMNIRQVGLFPKELIEDYVTTIVSRYDRYEPLYIISGDTDFQTQEVIEEYYGKALEKVKELSPNSLTAMHIRGRYKEIPAYFLKEPSVDFYMYQSGHNQQFQETAYSLADYFYHKEPTKPVINSEPCYEMMGYSRREYGRFNRQDVRKVAWQSILAGANAGITYGAHGIWSWHDENLYFDSSIGEAFETPYDWREALKFEGASDYGFIRQFFETEQLFGIEPAQHLLLNGKSTGMLESSESRKTVATEIRIAENERLILVYVPSNIQIKLSGDYSQRDAYFIDLENNRRSGATCEFNLEKNQTTFKMSRFVHDTLLVILKQS